MSAGEVLLPRNAQVLGRVVESKSAGRFGRSSLTLTFDRALLPDGSEMPLTATLQEVGPGDPKKQGRIVGGAAIGGAVLGRVLGDDAGSAFWGAVVGSAIAAGSIAAEPGEPVVLPAGTALRVRLNSLP